MRTLRGILTVLGAVTAIFGVYEIWQTVSLKGIGGLLFWLVLALVIHDGLIGMTLLVISVILQRIGKRIPAAVSGVIQTGFFTGAVLSVIAVLSIAAKAAGTRNPTVLPLDYASGLTWLWLAVAVATGLTCALVVAISRRKTTPQTNIRKQ